MVRALDLSERGASKGGYPVLCYKSWQNCSWAVMIGGMRVVLVGHDVTASETVTCGVIMAARSGQP